MMRPARAIALLLALLPPGGCGPTAGGTAGDPWPGGVWHPNGANEANLRAMVEVPSDLAAATPASASDGTLAANAVDRLRHDRLRPLLDNGVKILVPSAPQPAPARSASGGTAE